MSSTVSPTNFRELLELDPADVCRRSQCSHDSGTYTLTCWDIPYMIDPAANLIQPARGAAQLHPFFDLFVIHHLLSAREVTPEGEWISEKDMPGGATFFRGPHAVPTEDITGTIGNDLSLFREKCLAFGGTPLEMADAAFCFTITRRVPMAVLYWIGDDDFPAEAKLLFDRTITRHLELDGIFALMVSVCDRFGR